MKGKIGAIILAIVMIFGLIACIVNKQRFYPFVKIPVRGTL